MNRITVFVDDRPVRIWGWARVRHALIWHSEDAFLRVRGGESSLTDGAGQRVDLEGSLCDGARFYVDGPPGTGRGTVRDW
jgi:hypothetical protein